MLRRLCDEGRVVTRLDTVIRAHLAETADRWAQDTVDCEPHLPADAVRAMTEAALHAGYFLGRLLVGTVDTGQDWSDEPDREALLGWLDEVVEVIDWSGIWPLVDAEKDGEIAGAAGAALGDILRRRALHGDGEAAGRASVFFDNGLCVALVEHSVFRPVTQPVWVDLSVMRDVLPADPAERLYIAEALGCLLSRVDRRGRCSEAELRDAADELGGERGHRYFRLLRRWGVIDYTLTRRGTGTVHVPRHRELCGGPLAS